MSTVSPQQPEAVQLPEVVLWWLPVGQPGRFSPITSAWWERLQAWRERRVPHQLFHSALEVFVGGEHFVIEMAPEWSGPQDLGRGVVARGPVGIRYLGRFRWFRYEVRCCVNGELSDKSWAVGGPVVVTREDAKARSLLRYIEHVPVLTWGRSVRPSGDMWNSNSLVSWLLVTSGIDVSALTPPNGGRAPGWDAGIDIARQDETTPKRLSRTGQCSNHPTPARYE